MIFKELFKTIENKYKKNRNVRVFYEEEGVSISDNGFKKMLKKHGKREIANYTEELFENKNLSELFLEKQYTCLIKVIFSDNVKSVDSNELDHFKYDIAFFKSFVGVKAEDYCSKEYLTTYPEVEETKLGLMMGMFEIRWKTTLDTKQELPQNAYAYLFEMNNVETIQELGEILMKSLQEEWDCDVQFAKPSFDHIKYIFYDKNQKIIANRKMDFKNDLEQFLIKTL